MADKLNGLLAHQDGAHDFWRKVGETDEDCQIVASHSQPRRCCHTNSRRWACYESPMCNLSYHRHRFPAEVIQYTVWLYFRFPLSYRDVEDMLAERGIDVSYETVRRWAVKFGAIIARKLRRGRSRPDVRWHLDEVFVSINGRQLYVWRALSR